MKKAIFIFIILLNCSTIFSQWIDIAPKDNLKMHKYFHIQFLDSLNGFISGEKSSDLKRTLLKTNDGGLSWTYISDWGQDHMYIVNNDTAVSLNNNIWRRSINGGISFDSIGEVASDHVFHVKDKGQLAFFIPSDSGMLKCIDYGLNWHKVSDIHLFNLQFINNNIGFAYAQGGPYSLYKTIDGGDSWQTLNNSVGFNIYQFINKDTAYALLKDYSTSLWHIERSIDGGNSWFRHHNDLIEAAFNFHFTSSQVGYTIFNYQDVYKTIDGGDSWHYHWTSPCKLLKYQSFSDENLFLFMIGPNNQDCFYKTTNGGGPIKTEIEREKEKLTNQFLNIYPNPTVDIITVQWNSLKNDIAKISIYDAIGKTTYSQKVFNNNEKISVSKFDKGVYIIELETGDGILRKKFVIE